MEDFGHWPTRIRYCRTKTGGDVNVKWPRPIREKYIIIYAYQRKVLQEARLSTLQIRWSTSFGHGTFHDRIMEAWPKLKCTGLALLLRAYQSVLWCAVVVSTAWSLAQRYCAAVMTHLNLVWLSILSPTDPTVKQHRWKKNIYRSFAKGTLVLQNVLPLHTREIHQISPFLRPSCIGLAPSSCANRQHVGSARCRVWLWPASAPTSNDITKYELLWTVHICSSFTIIFQFPCCFLTFHH